MNHRQEKTARVIHAILIMFAALGGMFVLAGGPRGVEPVIIDWFSLDGGGEVKVESSDGVIELGGTVGQPDAGALAIDDGSQSIEIVSGFWAVVFVEGDCDEDGTLDAVEIAACPPDCEPDCTPEQLFCQDCNTNDILDGCEIATGEADDCNGNLVPDECDIADGTSEDCETGPGNGIPDDCEIIDGEMDRDSDGILDHCDMELKFFSDWTGDTDDSTWETAGNWLPDDRVPNNAEGTLPPTRYCASIGVDPVGSFEVEGALFSVIIESLTLRDSTLFLSHPLTTHVGTLVDAGAELRLEPPTGNDAATLLDGILTVATGGTVTAAGSVSGDRTISSDVDNSGTVRVNGSRALTLDGPSSMNRFGGLIDVRAGASLIVSSPIFLQDGQLTLSTGTITVDEAVYDNGSNAETLIVGGTIEAIEGGIANRCGGLISLSGAFGGQLDGDILNDGEIFVDSQAEATLNGDLTITECGILSGDGEFVITGASLDLSIEGGTLELFGLGGNDLIEVESFDISSVGGETAEVNLDGEMDVIVNTNVNIGCFFGGSGARGCTPPVFKVTENAQMMLGGDFVNQSSGADVFDYFGALIFDGVNLEAQTFEAASKDFGAVDEGLIDNFAIGTFEVAAGSSVLLVDNFENQSSCPEAVYVGHLTLEAGATLTTDDIPLYYETITNSGTIMGTVTQIDPGLPPSDPCAVPCEGDANGDGTVDPLDTGFVQARFGCPVGTGDVNCDAADANGDNAVDPLDTGFVQARFGACD